MYLSISARALFYAKQYDKSLILYKEAIKDFEKIGDIGSVTSCTRSVGMILRDQGSPDYEAALKYLGKALELDERLKSTWGKARNHFEIAVCYFLQGNLNPALETAELARNLWQTIGHIDSRKAEKLLSTIKSILDSEK